MLVPVPALVPPPLFRARVVPVGFEGEIKLTDAKRDVRAVGVAWRNPDGTGRLPRRSLVVFGGVGVLGQGTGRDDRESQPVAITGARSFTVRFSYLYSDSFLSFRRARLDGRTIRIGGRVTRPRGIPGGLAPASRVVLRLGAELWPERRDGTYHAPEANTEWYPSRGGVEIGSADADRWRPVAGKGSEWVARDRLALVHEGGRTVPLAARTLGAPKGGFGKVLWVSRAGWLIVTVGQRNGLAWLEPVRR